MPADEQREKEYAVSEIRKQFSNAYAPWTEEEDAKLTQAIAVFSKLQSDAGRREFIKAWSVRLARKPGAISSRLNKLMGVPDEPKLPKAFHKKIAVARTVERQPVANISLNQQSKEALEAMESGQEHMFLTGRAGTGKSTLLRHFLGTTKKNVAVLAPTGVAALLVGGQTIHSFFRFPVGVTPDTVHPVASTKRKLYQALDTIVIDEVSMVRADLLDSVDKFLRMNGRTFKSPFGGVRMIFIGDLFQLPPVVPAHEEYIFKEEYTGPYFFDAHAFDSLPFRCIELTTVYRQREPQFIGALDAIRTGIFTDEHLQLLNSRHQQSADTTHNLEVHLTTRTFMADAVNKQKLAALPAKEIEFKGDIEGEISESDLPTGKVLRLKEGAQVMLLNNDSAKRWVNGDIGKIIRIVRGMQGARVEVELSGGRRELVGPYRWDKTRFALDADTRRVTSETVGSFTQLPLRLAWAVTIHKGQGKTFDRVVVDFGEGTFAHGQAYVALSRCTSLAGLALQTPLLRRHIFVDKHVKEFMKKHYA